MKSLIFTFALVMSLLTGQIVLAAAPVAQNSSPTTREDTAKIIPLRATDSDNDILTYTIVTPPPANKGTLGAVSGNTVRFIPKLNWNSGLGGTNKASFTFTATDAAGNVSNVATVRVTVTPVNDKPVAKAIPLPSNPTGATTVEDTPKAITLVATDVDGDPITYAVAMQPAHGTLGAVSSNSVTYTPTLDYHGVDAFTYTASDGTLTSVAKTASLTVTAANDAPLASDGASNTAEDVPVDVSLSASDADGDALTYSVVSATNGTCVISASNSASFAPAENFNGAGTCVFKANDGALDSNEATVTVSVSAVDDAPVCADVAGNATEDAAITTAIALNCTDAENEALTYSVVTTTLNHYSTPTISGSNLNYRPKAGFSGIDAFTYKATESGAGGLVSNTANGTITVTNVNDAPTISTLPSPLATTDEDVPVQIDLAPYASDIDGDVLSYVVTANSGGTAVIDANGLATFTPDLNANGNSKSFAFKVTDPDGLASAVKTAYVNVTAVNDAPTAMGGAVAATEDANKVISLNTYTDDLETAETSLTYAIVTPPAHGILTGTTYSRTYDPNDNFVGEDSFTYTASDGALISNVATVTITVSAVNDAPVVTTISTQTINEDEPLVYDLAPHVSDPDGDALVYTVISAYGGTATIDANGLSTFAPTLNVNGNGKNFVFKVTDPANASSGNKTVTINVTAVNDAPTAIDGAVDATEDVNKVISLNTYTDDAETAETSLTYAIVTPPAHGVLTGTTYSRTYDPNDNFGGTDSFTFTASDGVATSNVGTVTINVAAANDAPTAAIATVEGSQNVPGVIDVKPLAADPDGDALTYELYGTAVGGTQSIDGVNGLVTFTPSVGVGGTAYFQYKAKDSANAFSAAARVTVTIVNPGNHAPTANDTEVEVTENVIQAGITLPVSDEDGDALVYYIVTQPAHGTVTKDNASYIGGSYCPTIIGPCTNALDGNTCENEIWCHTALKFTPEAGYVGPDSFTYKVSDRQVDSNIATVSLTVGEPAPPVALGQSFSFDNTDSAALALAAEGAGTLQYSLVTQPQHGTATILGATNVVQYAPQAGYVGTDSFTFQVTDATSGLASEAGTVNLNVTAASPSLQTQEDVAVEASLPQYQWALQTSQCSYFPSTLGVPVVTTFDVTGTTSLGANAGAAQPDATVTLQAGSGAPQSSASSADGDMKLIYTPPPDFVGEDTILVKTSVAQEPQCDTQGITWIAGVRENFLTVTVTVADNPNDFDANDLEATTKEETPVAITLTSANAQGPVNYALVTPPANGTASVSGDQATYAPNGDFNGFDSFTYAATDDTGTTGPATVSVTVESLGDDPVASDVVAVTDENAPVAVTLTCTDTDTDAADLEYIVTQTEPGTSAVLGDQLTFTPAVDFSGEASVSYQCTDGGGASGTGQVLITVNGDNDPPTADSFAVTVEEELTERIRLTGKDPEGQVLSFSISANPANGTVTMDGDTAVYVPNPNYFGADSFTYVAADSAGLSSAAATVDIDVEDVPEDPYVATACPPIDSSHIATDAATGAEYFDNALHVITTGPLTEDQKNELLSVSGALSILCSSERPDSGGSYSTFGEYTLELAPKTMAELEALVLDVMTLSGYVTDALPDIIHMSQLTAETDAESATQEMDDANKGPIDRRYGLPFFQGAMEYVAAFQRQGGRLESVKVGIVDTGLCYLGPGTCNIQEEFNGAVVDSGTGLAHDGLFESVTDPNVHGYFHGTTVGYLIGAKSNGQILTPEGLQDEPSYSTGGAVGNGVLGAFKDFDYSLYSYVNPDLATTPSTVVRPTYRDTIVDLCKNAEISNHSYAYDINGIDVTGKRRAAAHDRKIFEDVCPDDRLAVFAAGNDGNDVDSSYSGILVSQGLQNGLTVGSTYSWGTKRTDSNHGDATVTVYAMGEGTSFAAPIVSGAAGLFKAINPAMNASSLKPRIEESAYPSADGYPLLDIAAGTLLTIKEVKPTFVPSSLITAEYHAEPDLAELRALSGYTSGTHRESGWWRLESDKILAIERRAEEESLNLADMAAGSADDYDWKMSSKFSGTRKYELGLQTLTKSGHKAPVLYHHPKSDSLKLQGTLGGSGTSTAYAPPDAPNAEQEYDGYFAQAYCASLETSYAVTPGGDGAVDKGYPVVLGHDGPYTLPDFAQDLTNSTLTANVVIEHNSDRDPYPEMAPPVCTGDITAPFTAAHDDGDTGWNEDSRDCHKGFAHVEATFSDMSCTVQFRDDSFLSSSPIIPWGDYDQDVDLEENGIFHSFGYGLGVQDTTVCTVTADVHLTLVYTQEYDSHYRSYPGWSNYDVWVGDECGSPEDRFERVAKGDLDFTATIDWDLAHGSFPVQKVFDEIRDRITQVPGMDDLGTRYEAVVNPFVIEEGTVFLPTDLLSGGQILPAFGKGMDPVHWAHGIGPVKSHEMTLEYRQFEVKQLQKEDRTVR